MPTRDLLRAAAALLATLGCIRDVELASAPVLVHCAGDGESPAQATACAARAPARAGTCGHSQCLGGRHGLPASRGLLLVPLPAGQQRAACLRLGPGVRQHGTAVAGPRPAVASACDASGTCGGTLCAKAARPAPWLAIAVADAATPASARRPVLNAELRAKPAPAGMIVVAANAAWSAEGVSGCLLQSGCRVAGETCSNATDCCAGLCQVSANGAANCKALPGCKIISERCATAKDCCSGDLCGPDGRCQGAGGCFPKDERCQSNDDCCSGTCRSVPEGVLRCADVKGCKATGIECKKPRLTAATPRPCAMPTTAARWPASVERGTAVCDGRGLLLRCACPASRASWLAAILRPRGCPMHRRGLLLGQLRRFPRALLARPLTVV
jgi:hypothetical protein